jgi:hypothetical protein
LDVFGPSFRATRVSLRSLVVLTLVSVVITVLGAAVFPPEQSFPDVICYHSAAELLASGQSPYDVEGQTRVQQSHGWDKETTVRKKYDFLPYYYPPWFALLWMAFLPLGFAGAKIAWFFLNVEATLVTGYLLKDVVPGVARWLPVLLAALFLFSLVAVLLGQTTILVFFLVVLSWRLLDANHDRSAGVALAWLSIKPQLTAVLLLAVLIWLIRQRRWKVVGSLFVTLAALALVSTILVPAWLLEMLRAPRVTPSPTEHYPWIGNTWFLVLKTLGLHGWLLGALTLAVALPLFGAILRAALIYKPDEPVRLEWEGEAPAEPDDRTFGRGKSVHEAAPQLGRSLALPMMATASSGTYLRRTGSLLDLMALSLIAAFFIAPYARHYDFPVLLIPLLVLLRDRPASPGVNLLLLAFVFLPYVQLYLLVQYRPLYDPEEVFLLEGSYFWVPVVLLLAWVVSKSSPSSGIPCPA